MTEPNTIPLITPPPETPKASFGQKLRAYFLTGLVVAGPLAITLYITWWFINLVDGWVKPWLPASQYTELPLNIPGFGLLIAFIGLTILGFLTASIVGRSLLDVSDLLLGRMPVVRSLYRGMKQIFETVFSQQGSSFRTAALVQFPGPGMWSIVFLSGPPLGSINEALPEPDAYVSCFLPCTPNPTTGFFFYLPRKDIIELKITVEDAAKIVMSAGLITPDEQQQKLKALANEARTSDDPKPEV
jgi:uncharacterized membrane protein